MKFTLTHFTLFIIILLHICLPSCNKSSGDDCPKPGSLTIKHNGPVTEGWPLHLEADMQSTSYLYKWSGPNGWKLSYEIFSSDAYIQTRYNVSLADSGEYKLQLVQDGCVKYEGSVVVDVNHASSAL